MTKRIIIYTKGDNQRKMDYNRNVKQKRRLERARKRREERKRNCLACEKRENKDLHEKFGKNLDYKQKQKWHF